MWQPMLQRLTWWSVALLLFAPFAAAEPFTIRIAPTDASCSSGTLVVAGVRHAWRAGEALVIESDRLSRVVVHAKDCWAPDVTLSPSEITIPVWRRRELRGRLSVARGERLPDAVALRIT
ncbi:MAG: hypothetical protein ACLGH0_04175, partial [Thermoanaerobaculia bacterium]